MVANFVKKYTLTRSLPNSFCDDRNSLTTKKEFEFYCLYLIVLNPFRIIHSLYKMCKNTYDMYQPDRYVDGKAKKS